MEISKPLNEETEAEKGQSASSPVCSSVPVTSGEMNSTTER